MSILADYHVHSPFSADATEQEVEDIFKKAIKGNVKEVCITDHRDVKTPINPGGKNEPNHTELRKIVSELQPKYPDVIVKVGCEYSLHTKNAAELEWALKEHDLNFVIASVHATEEYVFSRQISQFGDDDHEAIHLNYLTTMYDGIKSTNAYSVVGHFDGIERYNKNYPLDFIKHRDLLYALLQTLADNDKGIEINTAFLAMKRTYPHPRPELLKMFKEVGGKIITVGSDAHANEPIGYKFDMVPEYLKSLGFETYCTFDGYDNPNFHSVDSLSL